MNTFETQQTKCSNCGTMLTLTSGVESQMECPICHQHLSDPEIATVNLVDAEKMVKFSVTKAEFAEQMAKVLTDTPYVPTDIFNTISPDKMKKAYVPMFVFEGEFTTRWTCKVQHEDTDVEGKKRTEYVPADGKTSGHFFLLLSAHDSADIPAEIVSLVESIKYKPSDFVPFDNLVAYSKDADAPYLWDQNTQPAVQFKKRGMARLKSQAEDAAREQLKNEKYRSLKTEFSYTFSTEGLRVMVPIWFIYYLYRTQTYYFIMDGKGGAMAQRIPEDKQQTRQVKHRHSLELVIAVAAAIATPILIHLIGKIFGASLLGSWITWLIILAVWGYLFFRVFTSKKKKANALIEAQALRSAAATRLLNSFRQ